MPDKKASSAEVEFCFQQSAFCWRDTLAWALPKHGGVYFAVGCRIVDIPRIVYPPELKHKFCDHKEFGVIE